MADIGLPLVVGFLGTGILLIFLGSHIKEKDDESDVANPFMTFSKVLLFALAIYMVYLTFATMNTLVKFQVTNSSLQDNLTKIVGSGFGITITGGGIVIVLLLLMFIVLLFNFIPDMLEKRRKER